MKNRFAASLGVITLLVSLTAYADDKSLVSSARELAKLGLQDYDAGNYEEAAKKLGQAYAVVHVPTLAVDQARALMKLGKWVNASELYLEAMNIPKDGSWQAVQLDAQREAEAERKNLLPRIPRVRVAVVGANATDITVVVDGTEIPKALHDAEQLLDPGTRNIRGLRGSETITESVTLNEGERRTVTLRFPQPDAASKAPDVPPLTRRNQTLANTDVVSSSLERKNPTQKTLGWISLGIGGVGVATGTVAGLLALSKRSTLRNSGACSDDLRHCDPGEQSAIDSYNTWRVVSSVGFISGGVLAATGVTLLLTSPKQSTDSQLSFSIGPSSATLLGAF